MYRFNRESFRANIRLAKSDCLTTRKPKTLPTNISARPLPVLPHANDWVSKHFHGTLPAILGWLCITNQRIDHVKDCSTLRRSGFWIGQWGIFTIHRPNLSDGHGQAEYDEHQFPCREEGQRNWHVIRWRFWND